MHSPHCVGQMSGLSPVLGIESLLGASLHVIVLAQMFRSALANMGAPERWHIQDGRRDVEKKSPPNRRVGDTVPRARQPS